MNLRIARAFWFYHATRTWPFLFAGLSLGVGMAISFGVVFRDEVGSSHNFLVGLLFGSLAIQFLGMLYNASFTGSLSCLLPESTVLLPASSFSIAFHRFTFNLTMTAGTTLLLYTLVRALYGETQWEWWVWPMATMGLCALLQAVALLTAPTGDWTLGFLVAAAVFYAVLPTPEVNASHPFAIIFAHPVARIFLDVPVPTILLSFLGTWAAVQMQREGSWSFTVSTTPRGVAMPRHDRTLKPFKSAWHAHLWLETLRYWRPVSRTFIVLVAGYLVLLALRAGTDSNIGPFRLDMQSPETHFFILGYFAFTATLIGGIAVSLQNRRIQTGPMAAFLYIRPISTLQLGSIRIVAALLNWTVVAAIAVAWTATARLVYEAADTDLATTQIIAIAVPLIATLWAGLWTWNLITLVAIYMVALGLALPFAMNNPLRDDEYVAFAFSAFLILSVGIVFVLALRNRLIQKKLLWGFISALISGAVIWLTGITSWATDLTVTREVRLDGYMIFAAILTFLIAPIASVPLAHHWSRHR